MYQAKTKKFLLENKNHSLNIQQLGQMLILQVHLVQVNQQYLHDIVDQYRYAK